MRFNDLDRLDLADCAADAAATPETPQPTYTLTVTAGAGGAVDPSGATTHAEAAEVTLRASWNDATHTFGGWGGDCADTEATCRIKMYADANVAATFTPLAADRCAAPTDADCLRAVYQGPPEDYAQVQEIPTELLLRPSADGRYQVERGQQVTVVTAAPLPAGYSRFYLQRRTSTSASPGTPPTSYERLVAPVGTSYTFTPTADEGGASSISFDLTAARPRPLPRPGQKPELGRVVVTTVFQLPVAPLTLELNSSRELCTANTLTELSWTITGGQPPYALTIDGQTVDAEAESQRANCGPIQMNPQTEEPLPNQTKTFSASVSDSQSSPVPAADRIAVELVQALPAPANVWVSVYPGFVYSNWDRVDGFGSQLPELDESQMSSVEQRKHTRDGYLVRYRTDAASAWTYAEHSEGGWTKLAGYLRPWDTPPPGTFYRMSVTAARHPLELETPDALNWSRPIRYTTSGPAQNLTVSATHNTATISWSKQPGTGGAYAYLDSPGGGGAKRYVAEGDEAGTHAVTFSHLKPDSDYLISILQLSGEARGAVRKRFRTEPGPPGWQPLPRGPHNLVATATHDTITVTWNPPFEGASPKWSAAMLDGQILVHSTRIDDGTTTWVSSGEVDSMGRYRILPGRTYTIIVTHKGIHRAEQTITVRTQTGSYARDASASAAETPVYRHPRLPFVIDWPLTVELRHYMVVDPWQWRSYRYHVGLDTGGFHSIPVGVSARRVHAVAAGVLRVFNDHPEHVSYALYCPHLPGPLHQQIVLHREGVMKDPTDPEKVICNFLVAPASGRSVLVFHDEHHISKYAHLDRGSFSVEQDL